MRTQCCERLLGPLGLTLGGSRGGFRRPMGFAEGILRGGLWEGFRGALGFCGRLPCFSLETFPSELF